MDSYDENIIYCIGNISYEDEKSSHPFAYDNVHFFWKLYIFYASTNDLVNR